MDPDPRTVQPAQRRVVTAEGDEPHQPQPPASPHPAPATTTTTTTAATTARSRKSRPPDRNKAAVARRYQAVIELAPDATVVADAEGLIRLVNRQTEVLFGYDRAELLGQPVETVIPARFHAAHRGHRAAYAAAPRTRSMGANLHLSGQRQDGSEFPVEVSLAPFDDNGESLVIASIRDVSELHRAHAARHEAETAYEELRRMQAVTDTALTHLELDDLLPELLVRVRDVMAVDNATVLLLDTDGRTLRVRASNGLEEEVAAGVRVPVGAGFAGRIAATLEPLIVEDLSTFPVVNSFLRERLRSAFGVPLVAQGHALRAVGVLHVGTIAARRFTPQDVRLLEQVAERMALAVERAQLYAAEQQARADAEQRARLLDQTHDAIFMWELGGAITYWNHGAELLYGYQRAEAVGQASHTLLRTEHPEPLADFEARLRREGEWTGELAHLTRDGRRVSVLSRQQVVRTPDGRQFVLESSSDITEVKWLERERAAAQATEQAVRAVNQHLDEFFRVAAHDLRQPLAVAKTSAEMSLRRFEGLVERLRARGGRRAEQAERVLETLRITNAGIDRAARLSAELFDVARARAGALKVMLAPLDLAALVPEQVAAQRLATPGRAIGFELLSDSPFVWVRGDAVRLGQVLANYLTNALKYSAADQPVEVRLEVVEGLAVVSVRDHGPGLPWEEQSQVWEMLHRAPGVEVQSGSDTSLGLGLYIVKQLMELHPGGRVGVESAVGEGSAFWFRLPVAPAPDAPAPSVGTPA